MTMNYPLIMIDYLLQVKEATGKFDLASALARLEEFSGQMTEKETEWTADILERIASL